MRDNDVRTLKIFEEIEKNEATSQRELARELNISLGLVNSFMKRLVQKGYFKITNIPKNRIKYILTPKGAAEKTRLTYEYIQFSYKFYKKARLQFRKLFKELELQGVRCVVFYGAGDLAEIAYISLQETSIELVALIDETKIGNKFMGEKIRHPDMLKSLIFDRIIITSMNAKNTILQNILKIKVLRNNVIMLE